MHKKVEIGIIKEIVLCAPCTTTTHARQASADLQNLYNFLI